MIHNMRSKIVRVSEIVIPIDVKKLRSGDYLATSRALRGLVAQGRTVAETIEIAQEDVAKKLIESYQEHGNPLPAAIQKQMGRKPKTSHLQIPVAVNF